MERSHDRRMQRLLGSLVFALFFAACGGSGDTTGGGGNGGSAGTGSAGSVGSTGSGGSVGTTGSAGTTSSAGTIGTGGSVGSTGSGGSVGTTGSAGTTGTGGATGGAGMAGVGGGAGATGRGGSGGSTGASGAGGASGRGGASGGGASGSGGAGGRGGASGAGGRGGASGAGGAAGVGGVAGIGGAGRGGSSGSSGGGGTAGSSSVDGGNWDAPPIGSMVGVHVAGDSTAAIFPASDGRVGWAAVLDPLFDGTVTVDDAALSGRSTKSYIDEGAWTTLQAKIKPGDYLIIEFGHNDEKSEDPTRYTDPATTYRTNLKTFIDGARARGGFPILATSICRRQFSGSTVTGTHGAYTTAVFAVGQQTNVPVLDMESRTKAWLTALGPTASVAKFATDDNTHLNMTGAVEVAKLAVAGIRDLGLPLASRALP